jgi:hypothetical protein
MNRIALERVFLFIFVTVAKKPATQYKRQKVIAYIFDL